MRYSVPEEIEKGSFVGNVAKDLGLEPLALAERGARIVSRGRTQLFALNPRNGSLVTAGRIDREELCAQNSVYADTIDGSPPGSAVPGILQARILEWVAISFSLLWTYTALQARD